MSEVFLVRKAASINQDMIQCSSEMHAREDAVETNVASTGGGSELLVSLEVWRKYWLQV